PQARARYEAALPIYREIGARLGEANCIKRLGDVHVRLSELPQARARYEAALPIYREIGDRLGEANTYTGLGDLALAEEQYPAAKEWYEKAWAIYEAIGERHWRTYIASYLATVYLNLNEVERAGQVLDEGAALSRAIAGQPNLSSIAWGFNDLGNMFDEKGDWAEATVAYTAAIDTDKVEAVFYRNRASALISLNRLEEAQADCEMASQLAADHAYTHGRWGDLHLARGEWLAAERRYRQAMAQSHDPGDWRFDLAVALWGQGITAEGWAEFEAALPLADAEKVKTMVREYGRMHTLFPSLSPLAEALARLQSVAA
ncbi:MAG TPA: tetratricopeptide repeat protein, partial [Chloroflexota bacterium]|nr:tetratricopeptide repeat protein [Chloroflexota bacterium]